MSDPTTLKEVARVARVSPSTVSRIVNGTAQVAPDKRAKVLAAIEQLNYRPNVMARGLKRGRSFSIGVLTQEIASPFYGELHKGIEQALAPSPYHPIFASDYGRGGQNPEALELLLGRRVDALISLGRYPLRERLLETASHLPVITVGWGVAGLEHLELRIDNVRGAQLGTRHLLDLGHRQIAYLAGPQSDPDARDRLAGYRAALTSARVKFDAGLVKEGFLTEAAGHAATEALLKSKMPFTAVFAGNDEAAYGARLALYERGLRVPEDVSLVGFDDLSTSAYVVPPLTTVRQPSFRMGQTAVQGVLALLEGQGFAPPAFEVELVVRRSTAPPPPSP